MALTVRAIDTLSSGKLADGTRLGLFIEFTGSKKVWRYYRRVRGSGVLVRQSLGPWPAFSVADARQWADSLNRQVDAGVDPRAVEREKRASEITVEAAHALYIAAMEQGARRALKPRTIADKQAIWKRDMAPRLTAKLLQDITANDLWDMIEAKGKVAAVRANRLAAEAKVFFAWCVSREGQRAGISLANDPAAALNGKHYAEGKGRTRILSDSEIGWLFRALAAETTKAADSYRRAFLLMLLTGARIGEVKGAPALEYCDGVWTIAAERSKNGQAHTIRLGSWGRAMMEVNGVWLIPHPAGGTIDSEVWYEVRDRLHARMERMARRQLAPWTPHDLRRTMRSNTFALGIRYEVAEAMLNHVKQGLERRYDLADLSDHVAAAFALWEAKLVRIVCETGLVVTLGVPDSALTGNVDLVSPS